MSIEMIEHAWQEAPLVLPDAVMPGMGAGGAKGMLEMKEGAAAAVAADEKSCVVAGMRGQAIRKGAADRVLPLEAITGPRQAKQTEL
jgi:chemotaxis response regulator CheB